VAAVAIVYIVMVATFGSLIQPLLLLISIPFAATGALGLLLLSDTALGVPALIGMLLLVGIVVTNAIVLIDLVNQYRKSGRSVEDSLIAGARQRLRPILMTALATIFALTPMALGVTGNSGFISKPLAIVVIGGLISSTVLTLVLVPVLYWLVEGRKERKAIRIARRQARKASKAAKKNVAAPAETSLEEATPVQAVAAERIEPLAQEPPIQSQLEPEPEIFRPAEIQETPGLAWSEEPTDLQIDDESSMQWSETPVTDMPAPAPTEPAAMELPATDATPVPMSKKEQREAKKAAKAERKAQLKAAKNSRHSKD